MYQRLASYVAEIGKAMLIAWSALMHKSFDMNLLQVLDGVDGEMTNEV